MKYYCMLFFLTLSHLLTAQRDTVSFYRNAVSVEGGGGNLGAVASTPEFSLHPSFMYTLELISEQSYKYKKVLKIH